MFWFHTIRVVRAEALFKKLSIGMITTPRVNKVRNIIFTDKNLHL